MQLQFECTQKHWIEYTTHAQQRALGHRSWAMWLTVWVLLVVVGVVVLQLCSVCRAQAAAFTIGVLAAAWATLAYTLFATNPIMKRYLRPGGVMLGHRTLTMSRDGLRIEASNFEARYTWAIFDTITVHKTIVVLWTDPAAGVLIPKDAFENPEARAAFVEQATSHIAAARPTA